MPNVMIIGYTKEAAVKIQKQVDELLQSLGEAHDGITTILEGSLVKGCGEAYGSPYLIVRNTKLERAKSIAEAINHTLNLEVEYEQIDGFLAARNLGLIPVFG